MTDWRHIPMPPQIQRLPRDKHGRPVPWFVAWFSGEPDHRIALQERQEQALRIGLCWVCGGIMSSYKAFVIGPMCAVNRISAEPPQHRDCSIYSAIACPFLSTPGMRRRDTGKAEAGTTPPSEFSLQRNPGVALVWVTKQARPKRGEGLLLWEMGHPTDLLWYAEGRAATRAEVLASLESGLPSLRELAEQDGPAAVDDLEARITKARALVPA